MLPFVAPMCGVALLRDLIHALGTDLHLHPFARRRHHRGVQALVTVGLGNGNPVAQAVRVGRIEIRHHTVGPPGIALLLLLLGIQDNTNGEDVVDVLERHLLLLHLVPDARNGLRPALDGKLEAFLGQRLPDGRSKRVDEARPDRFGLAQFLLNLSVFLGLPVAQAQILELTFDRVQAQSVRKRRVHEVGFSRNLELLLPLHAIECPHVVQPVGNLDQDNADVITQREQHLPKILRLSTLCRVEYPRNLGQPIDDGPLPLAEHPLNVVQRHPGVLHRVVQQCTHDARGVEAHLLRADPCH